MVRCHLSVLLERKGLRIAELARETRLNRSTITALCKNSATRVELPVMDRLCCYFGCRVGDLFEYVPDESVSGPGSGGTHGGSRKPGRGFEP